MFPLQYRPSTGIWRVWVSNIFLGPDNTWASKPGDLRDLPKADVFSLGLVGVLGSSGNYERLRSFQNLLIGGVAVSTVIDRDGVNLPIFFRVDDSGVLSGCQERKKIRQIPWIVSTTQFWSGWFMNVSHVIIWGFLGLTWTGFTLQVRAGMCYTPGHAMCDSKQALFSNIQPARPATSQPSQTTAWVCQDGFKNWNHNNHNIHSYGIDDNPWILSVFTVAHVKLVIYPMISHCITLYPVFWLLKSR